MIGKKPITVKTYEKLNSDIYTEDLALLNQVIIENGLSSRKDGLHVLANTVRGYGVEKKQVCQYQFGGFCTNEPEAPQKKLRKIDTEYCQACMQAQKNKALQDEGEQVRQELFDLCQVSEKNRSHPFYKWGLIVEWIDNLNLEIEDLQKPVAEFLKEISDNKEFAFKKCAEVRQLEKEITRMNQQFDMLVEKALSDERQKVVVLETDNTMLREELEKIQRTSIYEKNAWLTVEIQQSNQKIVDLETENQQLKLLVGHKTAQVTNR